VAKKMTLKEGSESDYFPTKKLMNASSQDQLQGEAILIQWISEDLRPFKIVEDRGLLDFCNFYAILDRNSRCRLERESGVS
jgi:hypothetical protein